MKCISNNQKYTFQNFPTLRDKIVKEENFERFNLNNSIVNYVL